MRRLIALAALLALAACGGSKPAPPPDDRILERDTRAGRLAFAQDRPEEAVTQYRLALRRAEERDDLAAIGDLGYDLAVAELAANQAKDALATSRATRAELVRRGAPAFPGLDLVEATALYRTGAAAQADTLAAQAQAAGNAAGDTDAVGRASLLRGLIADERGDIPALRAAAAALARPTTPTQDADSAELAARLRLRDGDAAGARADALRAAGLRRTGLDYRGVARALAVAGAAARAGGDMAGAADLYLRAGRSAAIQGDIAQARPWLAQARDLAGAGATDPQLRRAADAELKGLTAGP